MHEAVKAAVVTYQHNEASLETEVLPEEISGSASINVVKMDEGIASYTNPDQQNEEDS